MIVSILCNTYNHEKYIASAIDSFLMQETDFDFEICIHNDASTDNTKTIIDVYKDKYPEKIKVIHQIVNQQSQGKMVTLLNLEQASGHLIAMCEGDDYWIDPHKLQKQVNEFNNNHKLMLVVHAYQKNNIKHTNTKEVIFSEHNVKVELSMLLKQLNPLFHLSTMMLRRECFDWPEFFNNQRALDRTIPFSAILKGEILYLTDVMSHYRTAVNNSWTLRIAVNREEILKKFKHIKIFYQSLNNHLEFSYDKEITSLLDYIDLMINIRSLKRPTFKELLNVLGNVSNKKKISIFSEYLFPILFFKIRNFLIRNVI